MYSYMLNGLSLSMLYQCTMNTGYIAPATSPHVCRRRARSASGFSFWGTGDATGIAGWMAGGAPRRAAPRHAHDVHTVQCVFNLTAVILDAPLCTAVYVRRSRAPSVVVGASERAAGTQTGHAPPILASPLVAPLRRRHSLTHAIDPLARRLSSTALTHSHAPPMRLPCTHNLQSPLAPRRYMNSSTSSCVLSVRFIAATKSALPPSDILEPSRRSFAISASERSRSVSARCNRC